MLNNIYISGDYARAHPDYHTTDSPWKAKNIASILNKNGVTPRSVCEVGCGAGEILRQLLPLFPQAVFYGYDISPQAIGMAQEHPSERLQFRCEDVLVTCSNQFDLLLCIDVIEHVDDYLGFV